jgi:hypothetical protein
VSNFPRPTQLYDLPESVGIRGIRRVTVEVGMDKLPA